MKVFLYTLGCKVNSCETESMAAVLAQNGFEPAETLEAADIVVVNSCTVTEASDKKTRSFIRRAKRRNPDVLTVLTGCFPQAYPKESAALLDADIVTGNTRRKDIADFIFRFLETGDRIVDISSHKENDVMWHVPLNTQGRTRAFMKIEDGCDNRCSYCILPIARGSVRSLPLDSIRDQALRFAANGYKEIVLTGINLSSYGKETGLSLADAVFAADVPGIERIRLSSLEPELMSESLTERLSGCQKLCAQFHLSLQSGCDRTLSDMGRRYTAGDFRDVMIMLQKYFDEPTFTTDIMVGFPTETDDDFNESMRFVTGCGFLKCHIFSYSARPGTEAAKLSQIPKVIRESRAKSMADAANDMRRAVMARQIGKKVQVVAEKINPGEEAEGFSERYVPVKVRGLGIRQGDMVGAVITGVGDGFCLAEKV